jgi:PAS domain S-box-containing protein
MSKKQKGLKKNQDFVYGNKYFLKGLVESSLYGILVVDRSGKILLSNRLFAKTWGVPAELIKDGDDKKLLSFVIGKLKNPKLFLEKVKYLYLHINQKSNDIIEMKDGRFFQRYSAPLRGDNNIYFGRVWYFRDVTKIKKAEIDLAMSESKCRMVFDSATDIVFLTKIEGANGLGKFLEINRSGCRQLGYSKKELLQMTPWDVVTKESLVNAVENLKKLKKYGHDTFERVFITKHGKHIPVEMNVRLINVFGQPTLMAISRNISERKNAEYILQEEKRKLQRYLDVSGVITILFNDNFEVMLINKKGCEVLGCQAEDVVGKNWINLFVAQGYRREIKEKIREFLKSNSKDVLITENLVRAAGGEERNIVWRFGLLADSPGKEAVALGVGNDVTDFKRAKATIGELKELNNLKDEFLNIATHELKTPLTSIIGLSEIMVDKMGSLPGKYPEYLRIIHSEGLRLAKIMKKMLDVARYESGRITVLRERFDLSKFLRSLSPALLVLVEDKIFSIKINKEAEGLFAYSDQQKISQVVYDLVDNAVKHAEGVKKIILSLRKKDDKTAVIEVIDDGRGYFRERS